MTTITMTVTGLRSHKLFGEDYNQHQYIQMVNDFTNFLIRHPEITSISNGMATGFDLLFGLATLRAQKLGHGAILQAFIPGAEQTKYYNDKEKLIYDYILAKIGDENIHVLSDKPATAKLLKKRNRIMVDRDDMVFACWNGEKFKSGTWSTINYAVKKDKTVFVYNPFRVATSGYYHISQTGKQLIMRPKGQHNPEEVAGYIDEL